MIKPIYLYITPFFPSPKTWQGGFCLDAVKALKRDGWYNVVVMTAEDFGGDYEIEGIKVYQFPRVKFGAWEYFETFLIPWKKHLFLKKLAAIGIQPKNIAVCHVHDYEHYIPYALAIKKRNPKCLTLVHHHYAGYYRLNIGSLGIVPIWSDVLYLKMRREFEAVDAHIFISKHCMSKYGRRVDFDTGVDKGPLQNQLPWGRFYRSIRLPRGYVLYNGVDQSVFNRGEGEVEVEQRRDDCFVIGCAANFNPCKRQIDLIKAVEIARRTVPSVKLKLVGEGKTLVECMNYVKEHKLDDCIEFIKPMVHDKLPEFYRSLDLFVMPSVNEGFCCVNIEAHACGVPFVAVKGLPMEEVLDPKDYEEWLVPPRNPISLAKTICCRINNQKQQSLAINLDSHHLTNDFLEVVDNIKDEVAMC